VKNLTAVGKFLILTALLGSLSACASNSPYQSNSVKNSVVGPYSAANSLLYIGYREWKEHSFKLDDDQKRKQTGAVYSALEGEYGVVYRWYLGDAMGGAKAVHGYPQGSGFCKVVYSTIVKRDKETNFSETACKEEGHEGWRFIVK